MNASPLVVEKYVAIAGQIVDSPRLLESPVFAELVSDPSQPVVITSPPASKTSGDSSFVAVRKFAPQKNLPHVAEGRRHWSISLPRCGRDLRGWPSRCLRC